VIITSRRASWSGSLGIASLRLAPLSRDESVALLRCYRPDLTDETNLAQIAAAIGDLPLALHLTGSFLETYRDDRVFGSPETLLRELHERDLLDHDALQGIDVTTSYTRHDLHISRTISMSYTRLDPADATDQLALRLLGRAARFAPGQPIPRAMLFDSIAGENQPAQRRSTRALQRLEVLGLVELGPDETVMVHRLIVAFLLRIADDGAEKDVEDALLRAAMQPVYHPHSRTAHCSKNTCLQ
jgi:hypothetical protein